MHHNLRKLRMKLMRLPLFWRKFFKLCPLWSVSFTAFAALPEVPKDHYPRPLIKLDSLFSHHVILAEKSTHRLYLFRNQGGKPELLKVYPMATGKKLGDKIFQGDHRTPEGVYFLQDFIDHKSLMSRYGKEGAIYGAGAFVLNYPNPIDRREGKTGGGIWLHSTNDEARINKGLESRGCIVTANAHLIDVARYIEIHRTPIIVVHELAWLNRVAWEQKRARIQKAINDWVTAWKNEDFANYAGLYHKNFRDPIRGGLANFKSYKRAVFRNKGTPEITLDSLNILQYRDYIVATFRQHYSSNTIKDVGKKTLYLKKDEFYNWKIVAEMWSKAGIGEKVEDDVAFNPSMRFFQTTNPAQILGDILISRDSGDSKENSGTQ